MYAYNAFQDMGFFLIPLCNKCAVDMYTLGYVIPLYMYPYLYTQKW